MWFRHCQSTLSPEIQDQNCKNWEHWYADICNQLIPAPRGTGLVASPAVKRLLQLAGIQDAYTCSSGSTKTLENTLKATFVAVGNTYGFLTPNLWKETKLVRSPLEEFGDVLREGKRY